MFLNHFVQYSPRIASSYPKMEGVFNLWSQFRWQHEKKWFQQQKLRSGNIGWSVQGRGHLWKLKTWVQPQQLQKQKQGIQSAVWWTAVNELGPISLDHCQSFTDFRHCGSVGSGDGQKKEGFDENNTHTHTHTLTTVIFQDKPLERSFVLKRYWKQDRRTTTLALLSLWLKTNHDNSVIREREKALRQPTPTRRESER